jgi:hypothetical protein
MVDKRGSGVEGAGAVRRETWTNCRFVFEGADGSKTFLT